LQSGALRCWGPDDDINVNLLTGIKAVTTERVHCALSDVGGVRCWGNNVFGQVGDGTDNSQPEPPAADILSGVTQVISAWSYVCAVMSSSGLRCWGTPSGELGSPFIPATAPDLFTGAVQVAGHQFHRCAVMTDGDLRCWGDNSYGQLGDGTHTAKEAPGVIVLSDVKAVGVAQLHSCALSTSGKVRCWGNYLDGQPGTSAQAASEVLSDVQALSYDGTCALLASGEVQCWSPPYQGTTNPTPVTRICP